jgi:hypothetical protein
VQLDQVRLELDKSSDKPDHTYHLRSLATQVNAKIHVDLASQLIRDLLAEECDLQGAELDSFYRIILEGLA